MIVREAKLEDHRQLIALYDTFLETDRFLNLNNDSFQKVIESKNNFIFVAEADSKLIGLITASARLVIRYPRPIMQVDEFYVDAKLRRYGIGGKLMDAVENIARKNNMQRIYIESSYKHTLGHRFYEKSGYKNEGYYFRKVI